jgi:NAD(FAD)-utilizing enzyme possibly involved in translation
MTDKISPPLLHIIGGGLAGSEAAWQAAEMGVSVALHEMRPVRKTDVHETENLAELVCSNSFRSDDASAMRLAFFMRNEDADSVSWQSR